MKLTPIEIKNQEFKKGMRGYDPVEVDTFLELVADKYQELLEETERLSKQNLSMESELKNYREVEKTLKQTLQNMQESSELSKQNSAKEAGLIKKEAELAAAQLLEKTRLQVHKMREEVTSLQNQKHSFISRMRHLLSSQLELMDVLETDDLDLSRLKDRSKSPMAKAAVKTKAPQPQPSSAIRRSDDKGSSPPAKSGGSGQEKTHGKDLFNDIFGENPDSDR